ncbi:MAG: AI-2E family transporter [Rhodocyclaceae bacterium]|nr:AI-2E family transporter [Rhodocyclaceae bacterium]
MKRRLAKADPAILRLVVFVAALGAVSAILFFARRMLLPLLLGLVLAYILDPAVSWFEHRGRSRTLGTIFVFAGALVALTGFLFLVVPVINHQLVEVRQRFPQYRERIEERLLPVLEQAREAHPIQYEALQVRLRSIIEEKWPELVKSAFGWLGGIFSSALGLLLFLLDLIFVPVFAFYLLVDFPKLKRGVRDLVPRPFRDITRERVSEVNEAVSSFLRGQLTIAVILAAINGIGLTIIGVPMGLLLGIVAGFANMIPYMGVVVGLGPALLLCWIEHQSLGRLIAVAAVFAGAQMLEGTVLSPKILSKSVKIHPVWVLLSIIVGGRLFGLVGMLVAVPTAAAIQVFVRHWVVAYRRSAVYRGGEAEDPETPVVAPAPEVPPA